MRTAHRIEKKPRWLRAWTYLLIAGSLPAQVGLAQDASNRVDVQQEWGWPFKRTTGFSVPGDIRITVENAAGQTQRPASTTPFRVVMEPGQQAWDDANALPIRLSRDVVDELRSDLQAISKAVLEAEGCDIDEPTSARCTGRKDGLAELAREIAKLGTPCGPDCTASLAELQTRINDLSADVKALTDAEPPVADEITHTFAALQTELKRLQLGSEPPTQEPTAAQPTANVQTFVPRVALGVAPDPVQAPFKRPSASEAPSVEVSMAILPDPRVPRHRRAFDLAVQAIGSGLRARGYQLDSFDLTLRDPSSSGVGDIGGGTIPSGGATPTIAEDDDIGLLVYRRDAWRDPACDRERPTTSDRPQHAAESVERDCAQHYRLVYVVPERESRGVSFASFEHALGKMRDTMKRIDGTTRQVDASWMSSGYCGVESGSAVVAWGPHFSGSMASLRHAWANLGRGDRLCLVSPSTTVDSNVRAEHAFVQPDSGRRLLKVESAAVSDPAKLQQLAMFLEARDVEPEQVAFLLESSTFGNSVCPARTAAHPMQTARETAPEQNQPEPPAASEPITWSDAELRALCAHALRVPFPANIADIRYGRALQKELARKHNGSELLIPRLSRNLRIEEGAENTSEYPESSQSPITANGSELAIDAAVRALQRSRIRVVVIAATEVRDRLFLIELLRDELPNALFVDLEADTLLAHPDMVHATRGTLVLASSPLQALECTEDDCSKAESRRTLVVAQTDRQALLREIAADRASTRNREAAKPPSPHLHVVTREGLVPVPVDAARATGEVSRGRWISLALGLMALAALALQAALPGSREARKWLAIALGTAAIVFHIVAWFGELKTASGWLSMVFDPMLLAFGAAAWTFHVVQSKAVQSRRSFDYGDARPAALSFAWIASIVSIALLSFAVVASVGQAVLAAGWTVGDGSAFDPFDPWTGVSYGLALMLGVAAPLLLAGALRNAERDLRSDAQRLIVAIGAEPADQLREIVEPHRGDHGDGVLVVVLLATCGTVAILLPRPSVAGDAVAICIQVAMALLLVVAAVCLVAAWRERRMVVGVAHTLGSSRKATEGRSRPDGLEHVLKGMFEPAASPFAFRIAQLGEARDLVREPEHWSRCMRECIFEGNRGTAALRAVVLLLARSIQRLRNCLWLTIGASVCVVATGFLYPFTYLDLILLSALILLLAAALFSGWCAHELEHDAWVRTLLTLRSEERRWSAYTFGVVFGPMLVLVAVLAVINHPGVLQYGGLLELILAKLGGSAS